MFGKIRQQKNSMNLVSRTTYFAIALWALCLIPTTYAGPVLPVNKAEWRPEMSRIAPTSLSKLEPTKGNSKVQNESNLEQSESNHKVESGESIKIIFDLYGLNPQDLLQLIKSNSKALRIKAGQVLTWEQDQTGKLRQLTIYRNASIASRYKWSNNHYAFQPLKISSEKKRTTFKGQITRAFYPVALKQGLTISQIKTATNVLFWQFDVSRQAHLGDKFEITVQQAYAGDVPVDKGQIVAISYLSKGKLYQLVKYSDGHFYKPNGQSAEKRFNRRPITDKASISAPFNPYQMDLVTHQRKPHFGTDFDVPLGTPIFVTADGTIVELGYSATKGNYITVQHGLGYRTQYQHISQAFVMKGQQVLRGEALGLSGRNLESNRDLLHYELILNDRAVDAMKVSLPQAFPISNKEMINFKNHVESLDLPVAKSM